MIGKMLRHYRIIEKIGKGGMGVVYRAQDEHLDGRNVAIKVLPSGMLSDEHARERFRNEAVALSKLNHPSIGVVHDFDTQDHVDYLVMEFIPGQTLRNKLEARTFTEKEISDLGAQLADGLASAHDQGIVHRDLKPSNIMITPDGRIKILDFGLAKLVHPDISSDVITKSFAGTFPYMAPEQISGEPVDGRTDVYAAGNVLYEMAAGRRPFEKLSARDILMEPPPELSGFRTDLSPRLEEIILRCLEKDAGARYQSAKDLALDLKSLVSSDEKRMRLVIPRRRNWRVIGAALVAAVLILLARRFWPRYRSVPSYRPIHVTTGIPWEGQPALSPDGGRIAYVSTESGNRDIHIIGVLGGEPFRLTENPASDENPAWLPNGNEIVFTSDRGGQVAIWKKGQFGGAATLLVPAARGPAVSPDGSRIAFSKAMPSGPYRIGIADLLEPSGEIILTGDGDGLWAHSDPTWSPDGQMICYAGAQNLWLIPSKGGKARQLTVDNGFDAEPSWSADGRFIHFSSYRGGTLALWRIDAAGGPPERITTGSGPENHPDISKSGSLLAYSTATQRRQMVIHYRDTGMEVEVPDSRGEYHVTIAPDKSAIVFVSERWGGNPDLWILPLQNGIPGNSPRPLVQDVGTPSQPTYSPDGEWIAYYRIIGNERDIWIVPATGGKAEKITNHPATDVHAAWSPDGHMLAFASDRDDVSQVWIVSIKDGTASSPAKKLATPDVEAAAPAWSPEGDSIAFIGTSSGKTEVWMVPTDGKGSFMKVTTGADARRVRWDPRTGKLLVSGSWGTGITSLRLVSPEDGVAHDLDLQVTIGYRDRVALAGFPSHTTRHTGPYHGDSARLNALARIESG